jgi:hypothetical protein
MSGGDVTTDPLVGAVLAGRYRIVAPIGRGGAGAVYRGIQLQLDRQVAIKVVRNDVPEKAREEVQARFFREAALAGRLSHPAVVQTIDYGTTEHGLQFVVMELLVGRSLRDLIRKGPTPAAEVARIGAILARGLHHAHSKGLIHRDVKASNVLLVRDEEGREHPKLLDFGLVKSVARELDVTQTPTYLGTPLYMSPEQVMGSPDLDGRSDQYSLGCLMYGLACSVLPYVGESPMATALMHTQHPYPEMKDRVPEIDVDPGLEAIIRRCMEKSPEDRYPSAAVLAQALDDWRPTTVVPAGRPKGTSSAWRAGVLAFVAAMGIALTLGAIGLAWGLTAWRSMGSGLEQALADVDEGHDVLPGTLGEVIDDEPKDPAPEVVAVAPPKRPAPVVGPASDPIEPSAPPVEPRGPGAQPAPEPIPAPAPSQTDEIDPPVVIDDVAFVSRTQMAATLAFANRATREELIAAGINERHGMVDAVLSGRPYRSVQQLGRTPNVGPATMRALVDAATASP